MNAPQRIRIVVAEDSPTTASMLVRIFHSDPELEVIGVADDGLMAVQMVRHLRPDVVSMDIRMPRMDGIESTRRIMAETPTPVVIVSSIISPTETESSIAALGAGALAAVAKPPGPASAGFDSASRRLLSTVKATAGVKMARQPLAAVPAARVALDRLARRAGGRYRVVAIGASTGGPAVLATILARLPADFALPVLIVQHMSPGFHAGFARWLDGTCALEVKLAEHGEVITPGTVYVAPGGRHLGVQRSALELSDEDPVGLSRPSITRLFDSVAVAFGAATCAVILTGMGRDGVDGLVAVKAAGGHVIAQEEKSCAVFGMPQVAIAAGLTHRVLCPEAITETLVNLLGSVPALNAV